MLRSSHCTRFDHKVWSRKAGDRMAQAYALTLKTIVSISEPKETAALALHDATLECYEVVFLPCSRVVKLRCGSATTERFRGR